MARFAPGEVRGVDEVELGRRDIAGETAERPRDDEGDELAAPRVVAEGAASSPR
jgi:hypothetical protein